MKKEDVVKLISIFLEKDTYQIILKPDENITIVKRDFNSFDTDICLNRDEVLGVYDSLSKLVKGFHGKDLLGNDHFEGHTDEYKIYMTGTIEEQQIYLKISKNRVYQMRKSGFIFSRIALW